jgi:hypothetical protein
MLGREVDLPIDIAYGVDDLAGANSGKQEVDPYIENITERMISDFELARENLGKMAQLRKTRYDTKVNAKSFEVGQRVWYWNPRRFPKRSPKWERRFTGPFTVVRIIDSHVVVIQKSRKSKASCSQ